MYMYIPVYPSQRQVSNKAHGQNKDVGTFTRLSCEGLRFGPFGTSTLKSKNIEGITLCFLSYLVLKEDLSTTAQYLLWLTKMDVYTYIYK